MSLNASSNIGTIQYTNGSIDRAFNLSKPENASTTEFTDKVILDSIVHHDSPMYLLINRIATDNNFYIHPLSYQANNFQQGSGSVCVCKNICDRS